ncbi:hypothetical protein J31TS4_26730 [Paenibacillus sp. J31TS4]|uniref:S-layer homology domain-containing protein n=1 Tax=Paenibacillus sp. J31TS4 TaxID=2807195 RepID=UPI001B1AB78B|nr:S-layer homology domain-containing protein [Paenibacillus sp. J31TS4]GIP39393.1 hypothetical protein J31TS4_26730 [Paenibacillus sp. J31TS4]
MGIHTRVKRLLAVWLSAVLAITLLGGTFARPVPALAEAALAAEVTVTEAIYEAGKRILADGVRSEWQAVGLAKAGQTVPDSYVTGLEERIRAADGTFRLVTDYARLSLGIAAVGGKADSFAGYNLIERIYSNEKMLNQGLNGPIYALLALDSGDYAIPEGAAWSRDKLVAELIAKQNEDGGFSLGAWASDPDMTSIALTALAPYADKPEAKTAGERAVAWLAASQQPHGGFSSMGMDSSESVAQAIIALTANGIDPTGERFTKGGVHLITKLLSFQQADGGFAHVLPGGSNGMATEQAYLALVAYDLFTKGEGGLYRFAPAAPEPGPDPGPTPNPDPAPAPVKAEVVVEGPQEPVAEGAVEAATAMDALVELGKAKGIEIGITEASFGKYVHGIGSIPSGLYGGYDGWMFAVERDGQWEIPSVGMADYALRQGDRVLVYYGGDGTELTTVVASAPETPASGERFVVSVKKAAMDWSTGQLVEGPAAGVQVTATGTEPATASYSQSAVTDAEGNASLGGDLPAGAYRLTATGYVEGDAPTIVRSTRALTIAAAPSSGGGSGGGPVTPPAAKTVTLSVTGDSSAGILLPSTIVTLQTGDTAYSVLARQLGGRVVASGSGGSVYVQAIDGLAQFDRGPQSGWMFSVNGVFPTVSAGSYVLKENDSVAWRYTLDLGKDLGAGGSTGGSVGGGAAGGGGGSAPSGLAQLDRDIDGLAVKPDNKLPLGSAGTATAVRNADKRMSAARAEELRKELAANRAELEGTASISGETTLRDGKEELKLVIPATAVRQPVKLTGREETTSMAGLVSGLYELGPTGTVFETPVYLSIRVPVTTAQPSDLTLVWLDETSGKWIPIPAVLDAETGVLTGKVTHFTKFAVVDRSELAGASEDRRQQVRQALQAAVRHVQTGGALSDWEAFGLARAGYPVPAAYLAEAERQLKEAGGELRKITDYERLALAVLASGGDPASFGGINLIERIYSSERMTAQGTNGPVFALLALDSGGYQVPDGAAWTRDKLTAWLLEQQNASGGFPLVKGEEDNADLTAMAVAALAPYREAPAVKRAVDKAVQRLAEMQLASGGYALYDEPNSESTAQVLIALSALGLSPDSAAFAKPQGGLVARLLSYQNADGGFAHTAGGPSDELATEQALMALAAYQRLLDGQPGLYRLADQAEQGKTRYADDADIASWASDAVYRAFAAGIMTGTGENRFEPKREMTRAEFAAILVRLLKLPDGNAAEPVFADVQPNDWYFSAVMRAKKEGILQGVTDTTFEPNRPVSRQDMALMLARAYGLPETPEPSSYEDLAEIRPDALGAVQAVTAAKLLEGYNDRYYPEQAVSREMAAVVAVRLLDRNAN